MDLWLIILDEGLKFKRLWITEPVGSFISLFFSTLLLYIYHETGHYLWTVLVTKAQASYHLGRPDGQLSAYVLHELSESRFSEVREDPDKFKLDRKIAAFCGNLQLLPIWIAWLYFPKYYMNYLILILVYSVYSFSETFQRNYDEHPWILAAFSQERKDC